MIEKGSQSVSFIERISLLFRISTIRCSTVKLGLIVRDSTRLMDVVGTYTADKMSVWGELPPIKPGGVLKHNSLFFHAHHSAIYISSTP